MLLAEPLLFVAGRLCLDFVNTSCMRLGSPLELIGDEASLAEWLALANKYHPTSEPLSPLGERGRGEGLRDLPDSLAQAHTLRQALRQIVDAVREQTPPPADALETLNETLRTNPAYPQLSANLEQTVETTHPQTAWLTAIALDAADFFSHGDFTLLKQCECATCIRVFVDTTKNHKRRWCVEKCGSRVKAARYYHRKRLERTQQ